MTSIYTLCSKKRDAKIQITITMAYLITIKYPLSSFNYHPSDVNVANFNKIHRTVSDPIRCRFPAATDENGDFSPSTRRLPRMLRAQDSLTSVMLSAPDTCKNKEKIPIKAITYICYMDIVHRQTDARTIITCKHKDLKLMLGKIVQGEMSRSPAVLQVNTETDSFWLAILLARPAEWKCISHLINVHPQLNIDSCTECCHLSAT